MSALSGRRVLVGVTGGIAAYKSVYLCRLLQEEGCEVRVAMTASAAKFVTPLTFEAITQHPVAHSLFPEGEFVATRHISWAQWADLCIVAPATYNLVGKLAWGLADDALTTLVAALPASCPLYLALAMNSEMYAKPALQENVQKLSQGGVHIIDAEEGYLAERMEGKGRMAEPESIVEFVSNDLKSRMPWVGRRVVVTAGPTREAIDPVRYLTNASSGKMGYAVAQAALNAGADVMLITGPVQLDPPHGARVIQIVTAREMAAEVAMHWPEADALFMVAAVADFTPRDPAAHKLKKTDKGTLLALDPAPDVLAQCGKTKRAHQILVGFALETRNEEAEGRRKLSEKNLDLVVVNNPSTPGAGFDVDTNVVTLLTGEAKHALPLLPKSEVAKEIVARAIELLSRVGKVAT